MRYRKGINHFVFLLSFRKDRQKKVRILCKYALFVLYVFCLVIEWDKLAISFVKCSRSIPLGQLDSFLLYSFAKT